MSTYTHLDNTGATVQFSTARKKPPIWAVYAGHGAEWKLLGRAATDKSRDSWISEGKRKGWTLSYVAPVERVAS